MSIAITVLNSTNSELAGDEPTGQWSLCPLGSFQMSLLMSRLLATLVSGHDTNPQINY